MALKGITVNTAPEAEAHVYAEDDAAIFQSMFGSDGVLEVGQECESQVISNNKVRIKDGVIIVGGHIARIPYGEYVDCEIANGQSGKKRNDIIIGKFTTTGSGGIDTMTCEVKQGAAVTGTAEDPELTQNDIYQGGKIREMPLYRIKLDGLSITGVEPMFDLIPSIPTLNASLSDLTNKIKIVDILQCDIQYGGDGIIEGGGYHTCTGTIRSDKKISDCKFKAFFICSNYGVPMSDPTFLVRGDKDVTVQQPVQNYTDVDHTIITTLGVICYKD